MHHAGGMESVAWDLCRELARRADVTVLTTSVPDFPAEFTRDGVRVVTVPETRPGRYSREWLTGSAEYLRRELGRGDVSGVLSVSAGSFGAVDLPPRFGARLVMQAHGTSVMELTSKLTSRRLKPLLSSVRNLRGLARDVVTYRRFDDVVAIGPSVRDSLTRAPLGSLVGMPPVHLIENGVDRRVFRPGGVRPERPTLLVVGRLHPQKRVDRSIRLLPDLPQAELVLAGDGPGRPSLEKLAAELGVSGRVRFLGSVDRSRVPELYASADVSLLTSQWREGLPMAVLESLACGTPAVTSVTTAEVVDVGAAVTRVDAGDPSSLSAAVRATLARPRSGASLLPERYDLSTVTARYAELLGLA